MRASEVGADEVAVDRDGSVWLFIAATSSWHYVVPGETEDDLQLSWDGFRDEPSEVYEPYQVIRGGAARLIRRSVKY